eukprot:TRINITY_DN1921_c0_g2_i1.p1 TRINITY_DN1921_c0_g2~~TRINITY_DN1921_c0_g2_i1.p1  ORF type:complete len:284 (-),score=81.99 TRINITY_DN1921_c0_g2_i1:422-1273(-)
MDSIELFFFFFQAEDGIRDAQESRGLGDVYKRQASPFMVAPMMLRGPDGTCLQISDPQTRTVLQAKQQWSQAHAAPVHRIELMADGGSALDDGELVSPGDELVVRYLLAGAGVNFQFTCEKDWPKFCALGLFCNHCWVERFCPVMEWIKGDMSCCYNSIWCINQDCGLHKIWQCDLFCLGADCGKGLLDVHKPDCSTTTDFPGFMKLGWCCWHCWWDQWCCNYPKNAMGMNCCDGQMLCCDSNCGLGAMGFCELFCAQLQCITCKLTSPHHHDEHALSGMVSK